MNICVCVKMVPSGDDVRMDENNMLVREGILVTNPADESALEAALRLKGDGEVTLLTMGSQAAGAAVQTLLAHGADKAVLLSDPAMAGSDTLATAKTLCAAIRHLGEFDLLLCGRRAIDGETGQVPPELAMMMGLPFVTNVTRIWQDKEGFCGERLLEGGVETLRLPLPALFSLCEYSYALRPPSLSSLKKSRERKILMLDRKALALSAEDCGIKCSPTRVRRIIANSVPVRGGEYTKDIQQGAGCLAGMIREIKR